MTPLANTKLLKIALENPRTGNDVQLNDVLFVDKSSYVTKTLQDE